MKVWKKSVWLPLVLLLTAAGIGVSQTPPISSAKTATDLLKTECVSCHGEDLASGGIRLDKPLTAAHLQKVLQAIDYTHTIKMPPKGKLSATQIATLTNSLKPVEVNARNNHWAYKLPQRPAVPKAKNAKWVKKPIDAFVLAKLEKEKLSPSPEADKTTLIRRVTLDLTGLPPTPTEVDAFIADKSANAYETVVSRLLNSAHYGEKMALPWLDAARYADSNGFQQDGDTYQYIWRDWVVEAFNKNMPFDQFTIEQLAGDLLPNATTSQKIATAFNRNHLLNGEGGAIAEEQRNVILFDRVDVTATNWLGLTLACAQCHDHKFDPLSQKNYYQFMAFFNNVPESGTPPFGGQYRIAEPFLATISPADQAQIATYDRYIAQLTAQRELNNAEKKQLADFTRERDFLKNNKPKVMIMSDAQPRKTYLLDRGSYEVPKEEVNPSVPTIFGASPTIKNRLDLAHWLVGKENPLTARVQVNRLWQMFFGTGLVKTSENFGVQSEPPVHQELLDYLATDFQSDWNMKRLVRQIVTSNTYKQSSKVTPTLLTRDPENRLYARAARFRLSSLLLRDTALAASDLLNKRLGGRPVYPYQPAGIWDSLSITKERDFTYPQSVGSNLYRRSLYTFWRRTVGPGNMFDASTRQTCKVRTSTTSTPLHALTTLNDPTWIEAGRALAERVMLATPTPEARLTEAFRRVCARRPTTGELQTLCRTLDRAQTYYTAHPTEAIAYLKVGASPRNEKLNAIEHAAYASVCLAILNLDEALTRE
jgi:cytochrome c553